LLESKEYTVPTNQPISIADQIRKLANLKQEGLIKEDEFKQMKQLGRIPHRFAQGKLLNR
jgi:hypothetical protein